VRRLHRFDTSSSRSHISDVGKVIAKLRLTNYSDIVAKKLKARKGAPREVEIEALVDIGATRLYLKPSVIKSLGLTKTGSVTSRPTNGDRQRNVYSPVRLELMGRDGNFDVVDIDESVANLLGQIPLEFLDLVVDPKAQVLRPNPEHGDRLMTEEY
jgi:predicted aspartyl protease